MSYYPPRDPAIMRARFDLWLAQDMLYNNPKQGKVKLYKKYTKVEKVPYKGEVLRRLDNFEKLDSNGHNGMRAVAIKMDGLIRYLWRDQVLTESEYAEIQKEQKSGLGVLRKKFKGNVG